MSTIITMTSTSGNYQSGQTYRTRSKTAELLVAQGKATKLNVRRSASAGEGK